MLYTPGPQAIRSEDTRLVSYVLFDKLPGETSVELVERAEATCATRSTPGASRSPPA